MLKKFILLVLICKWSTLVFAQSESNFNKPDFAAIEKAGKDKDSPFYYKKLLKRYNDLDTTLTSDDYFNLYYGFSMQDGYSAYGKSVVLDDLNKAVKDGDKDKAIRLEKKVLKDYPFNLRNLFALSNMLEEKGEASESKIYHDKMIAIAKTIISTGDGQTDSTAMYVISVEHEYDMISLLGFTYGGGQSLIYAKSGPTDRMKLKENDEDLEFLYFNVSRLFASMGKK